MKTPEPGFFLKRPKHFKQTSIMMVARLNKHEIFKYYTRESIHPNEWDEGKKRAKEGKNYPEGWEINLRLEKYRLKFKSIFRDLIDKKIIPSRTLVREEMDKEFFEFLGKAGGLISYFDSTIEKMKTNKLMTVEGKPYSKGTLETFNTALKHLTDFQKIYSRKLDFDNIDMEFYYDYLDYFFDNNYSTNGIYNPIKKLKQILRMAEYDGHRVHPAYRSGKFVAPNELIDKIYLNEKEIERIYKYEYDLFSEIDAVRDRFVLACSTGVRFSDYEEICSDNIFTNKHGEFVKIRAAKTNSVAVIPLNRMAKKILVKYNYKLPEMLSNSDFNDYLKKIGKDAGIDEIVVITNTVGGKKNIKKYLKYDLIQTHTARRSFATNLFLAGYSSIEIMKLTGHKTEAQFLKYIRISSEEVAFKIAQDPRFKK